MIINLISSPRNISTATMYAFANHGQFKVIDEPFYAYYLNLTGIKHPGREEIIKSQPVNIPGVLKWIDELHEQHEHVFVKNMAHHLIDTSLDFLHDYVNVLLIRDPKELITSFAKVIPNPKMSDIGIQRQFEIYEFLSKECIILDSNETLKNPEGIFTQFFAKVGIQYNPQMLHWTPGAIPEDGVWAKYWYENVHASSGMGMKKNNTSPFPENSLDLLNESLPYYEQLKEKALKADQ
ncbi:sulfotransferase-like domain-containing protein [Marinoscillum pacificum]|uniref:sulfotransferase-like domain-containing protein n=1 Tax=Marinoscillum pacificum TaxID=392723 RepID=UPI00215867BE|nr:sulfotransferase family protein [Marinoscillum pacificum]